MPPSCHRLSCATRSRCSVFQPPTSASSPATYIHRLSLTYANPLPPSPPRRSSPTLAVSASRPLCCIPHSPSMGAPSRPDQLSHGRRLPPSSTSASPVTNYSPSSPLLSRLSLPLGAHRGSTSRVWRCYPSPRCVSLRLLPPTWHRPHPRLNYRLQHSRHCGPSRLARLPADLRADVVDPDLGDSTLFRIPN